MVKWTAALRIARRDALRARGRSVLIALMIAVPVLGMTTIGVLARTAQLDPDERVAWTMGSADAVVSYLGGPGMQHPTEESWNGTAQTSSSSSPSSSSSKDAAEPVDPTTLLPAGTRVIRSQRATVAVKTAAGTTRTEVEQLAYGDPLLAGLVVQVEGRAPERAGEVALSPALLERTGLRVGDTLVLTEPAARATVVGVARRHGYADTEAVLAAPGLLPASVLGRAAYERIYVDTPAPLTWPQIVALNTHGVAAYSRAVLLDPPQRAEVPYFANESGGSTSDAAYVLVLIAVVGMIASLEVVLLAGAAFAVGARRQARALAVVAAAGGETRHIRAIVLAGGLVLGVVGGVVGVVGGVGTAAVGRVVLLRLTGQEGGRFDVRPTELLVIALLGVLVGLLAAALPARAAARMDVVAALAGRRGVTRTARKVPAIGFLLVAAGIAAATAGSGIALAMSSEERGYSQTLYRTAAGLIAGGAGLTMIGLVVVSPAVVALLGRLGRHLPLTPRLAVRDASRNRSRTAPAVSAVLAGVTGATALTLYVAALDKHDRESYTARLPAGTASVTLSSWNGGAAPTYVDADAARAAVEPRLPVSKAVPLRTFEESCIDPASGCRHVSLVTPPAKQCPGGAPLDGTDPRCSESMPVLGAYLVVGDAALLDDLAVRTSAEARRLLDEGGVVVFDRNVIADGHVELAVHTTTEGEDVSPPATTARLPAVYVETVQPPAVAVVSEQAATALDVPVVASTLLLKLDRVPADAEEDAASAAVENLGLQSYDFYVERGYVSEYGLGLLALVIGSAIITLGAAGVATGLAQADSRPDYATLAAVGATPRMRRVFAACQAAVIAGLGTVLGIAAGFVPALAFLRASQSLELVLPWQNLLAVLVLIPLAAALLAGLLVRSQLPLERRLA